MAGPNLEVFKFAVYVFFPVIAFLHYGDPQWYHNNVLPYKDRLFPAEEKTARDLPTNHASVREELERIKKQKAARRAQKDRDEGRVVEEMPPPGQAARRLV
ncbi:hypothetical protein BV25DRAFT_1827448 [Artomyces pyxidatus]|uniref:Uncharacterized protein n=1 Tax=Artomyces pyxidatus TaxID=48021 RepID=A0ACB8SWX2_9AGAM|nr:hypothetical protein BV25DRAFT_1827448 [Artomyces pyxidatus]